MQKNQKGGTSVKRASAPIPAVTRSPSNVNRRRMMKGQRAMAVAMVYPEPEKGGRRNICEIQDFEGDPVRTLLRPHGRW